MTTSTPAYEPRPSRFGITQDSTLVRADGTEAAVTITNISQTGFRLEAAEAPTTGERVFLRGDAGDVPAQIRWAAGNTAGGVFLRPQEH